MTSYSSKGQQGKPAPVAQISQNQTGESDDLMPEPTDDNVLPSDRLPLPVIRPQTIVLPRPLYSYFPPTYDNSWEQQVRQRQEQLNQQQIIDELRRANAITEESASWKRFWEIENSHSRYSAPVYSQPIQPVSIYGGSTRIGNTIFHDYYSSDGQAVHGSTMLIGNSVYTDLYGN
jgi:hypothetical protein